MHKNRELTGNLEAVSSFRFRVSGFPWIIAPASAPPNIHKKRMIPKSKGLTRRDPKLIPHLIPRSLGDIPHLIPRFLGISPAEIWDIPSLVLGFASSSFRPPGDGARDLACDMPQIQKTSARRSRRSLDLCFLGDT